jgi:hypothetical protein
MLALWDYFWDWLAPLALYRVGAVDSPRYAVAASDAALWRAGAADRAAFATGAEDEGR